MSDPEDGQVSEVSGMPEGDAPISDGDAVAGQPAGQPAGESGEVQEPEPEAGPNANPHRDRDTH